MRRGSLKWRGTLFKISALSNASVTLLRQKNICDIPCAIGICVKKEKMDIGKNRYCSLMVHLLRGRELGFRNVFTDIRQCSKHRRWQTCENHGVYDHRFDECRLLYFVMCQGTIRAINDALYNETTTHAHESIRGIYILNVVKLINDIYIEIRDLTEIDNLRMTIDARKIISNLDIPLENEEWETLQNMKWGPLINKTYDDIIDLVDYFTI